MATISRDLLSLQTEEEVEAGLGTYGSLTVNVVYVSP